MKSRSPWPSPHQCATTQSLQIQTLNQGSLAIIRYVLTDARWAQIEPLCLGKKSAPGRTGEDGRLFLEAVLWIARTGSPWRDLPAELGNWNTVFHRFHC
ncbi:transposase [Hyphomonas sp.]|uniref:transposase n=1 Tax=Hyphomonas sp. TaxID=87 RepID=UPI00342585B6|nr:transposase [Alphaproteobacteria bacterium]